MSSPYVGEIRMFGGNFAPVGWMFCDGQLLPISQYETLFNLIGTTYGGDGQSTFGLPDLRGRVPIHQGTDSFGNNRVLAQNGGVETVTLSVSQIPVHNHVPQSFSNTGNQNSPAGGVWGLSSSGSLYSNTAPSIAMDPSAMGSAGGSQPHDNMIPFLGVNFILSLFGIFPSQT